MKNKVTRMEQETTRELLGDKVEKIIKAIGGHAVSKAVESITKTPCGCQQRKKQLNDWHVKYQQQRQRIQQEIDARKTSM